VGIAIVPESAGNDGDVGFRLGGGIEGQGALSPNVVSDLENSAEGLLNQPDRGGVSAALGRHCYDLPVHKLHTIAGREHPRLDHALIFVPRPAAEKYRTHAAIPSVPYPQWVAAQQPSPL
jgi:hypothetical protein